MNSPTPEIIFCSGQEDLAQQAAEAVTAALLVARDRPRLSLALAGGTTPLGLYRRLAASPLREAIPWERLEIFWGDERAVPPNHPESNFRSARETLLDHVPLSPGQIHRLQGESPKLKAEATRYAAEIRRVLGGKLPRIDLILLGLGADGHTASLFPGSPALTSTDLVAAVPAPSVGGLPRLTFTPHLLNAANSVFFLVAGPNKAPAIREVLKSQADPAACPARAVAPDEGTVRWFLDEDAAALL